MYKVIKKNYDKVIKAYCFLKKVKVSCQPTKQNVNSVILLNRKVYFFQRFSNKFLVFIIDISQNLFNKEQWSNTTLL